MDAPFPSAGSAFQHSEIDVDTGFSIVRGDSRGGALYSFPSIGRAPGRGRPCATPIFERALFFYSQEEPREIFT